MSNLSRQHGYWKVWAPSMLALLGLSCRGGTSSSEMPLVAGTVHTYDVLHGMQRHVETVKVGRRVPIGGATGYELKSDLGTYRLAWIGKQLVTDGGPYGRFNPPIPILDKLNKAVTWHGRITTVAEPIPAYGTVTMDSDKIEFGPKKVTTIHTVVALTLPDKKITLDSWFLPGTGLIKQQQRTGVQLNYSATLLN